MSKSTRSVLLLICLTVSDNRAATAQPWNTSRDVLAAVVREESAVDSILDQVQVKDLNVEAVRCREHRLNGRQFVVGFRNADVELVQFRPNNNLRQPNWYQTLCSLFGDDPRQNTWHVDPVLTSLFPSVVQSSIDPYPEMKAARSRQITFHRGTGQVFNVSSWQDDVVATGNIRWAYASAHMYRYVMRRRDGKAIAIVEGSAYQSQDVHPQAINLVRPFVHRPRDIATVMVASPDIFFAFMLRTCALKLDNAAGSSMYEQQIAKSIPVADRQAVRNARLGLVLQFGLREPSVSVATLANSIDESDRSYLLEQVTSRSRDRRSTRRRKLELIEAIGQPEHITYCSQFLENPAYKSQSTSAINAIAIREKIEIPPNHDANAAAWKE